MNKYYKYFEYAYLFFVALFLYRAYVTYTTSPSDVYIWIFFALMALGMFFFKRHFRKKYEKDQRKP